jgi:hypothetical protein
MLLISAMVNGVISDGVTLLLHNVKLDFLSAQLSWIFSPFIFISTMVLLPREGHRAAPPCSTPLQQTAIAIISIIYLALPSTVMMPIIVLYTSILQNPIP